MFKGFDAFDVEDRALPKSIQDMRTLTYWSEFAFWLQDPGTLLPPEGIFRLCGMYSTYRHITSQYPYIHHWHRDKQEALRDKILKSTELREVRDRVNWLYEQIAAATEDESAPPEEKKKQKNNQSTHVLTMLSGVPYVMWSESLPIIIAWKNAQTKDAKYRDHKLYSMMKVAALNALAVDSKKSAKAKEKAIKQFEDSMFSKSLSRDEWERLNTKVDVSKFRLSIGKGR